MKTGTWMGWVAAVGLVGGCAGPQHTQAINQLKSDIGLLDQRVSQLERASLGQPAATAWPTEPQTSKVAAPNAPTPSAPTAASPAPMLKPSKKEIQQALKNAGFYQGAVDGKIGPQTREAIKEFQRVNGLKADGTVGRQTWEQLAPHLAQSTTNSNDAGAVKSLK